MDVMGRGGGVLGGGRWVVWGLRAEAAKWIGYIGYERIILIIIVVRFISWH